jgi:hypothetical protein
MKVNQWNDYEKETKRLKLEIDQITEARVLAFKDTELPIWVKAELEARLTPYDKTVEHPPGEYQQHLKRERIKKLEIEAEAKQRLKDKKKTRPRLRRRTCQPAASRR